MHLNKGVKLKMIIAILLCMAFVVDVGATLAIVNYKFNAVSINTDNPSINNDTFVEFASAESAKGSFEYSPGVYNNQLSVNYGFSSGVNYDLMIEFTAVYSDTEKNNGTNIHLANDFTINFVNRNNWCVDMGTINGWTTENDVLEDDGKKYYVTGSADTQIDPATSKQIGVMTGVMYYMDTLTGSGSLPIISGVTFHTSPNNSYVYWGDKLTITLTPKYVKSSADNYTSNHKFSSSAMDADAFSNWYNYMAVKAGKTVADWSSKAMIYNAYVDEDRALAYPYDESVMTTQTITDGNQNQVTKKVVNTTLTTQPNYSNTAYRYAVTEEDGNTVRRFDAITAGNRYNGGLGVYVIPTDEVLTVSVSFSYSWYNWKTSQLAGTTSSLMVKCEYSDEFQTISTAQGDYRYYRGSVDAPIYIDVLKYIRLSAEDSETIITGGYSLLLNDISVGFVTDSTLKKDQRGSNYDWTGTYVRPNYEVHNATITSPILARVKDVATSTKTYDTDISVTNNNLVPMRISGFTISSKLWYAYYADSQSSCVENAMGDGYLPNTGLKYDTTLWKVSNYNAGVFTFALQSGKSIYVPSGYSLTLINGVQIPATSACQTESVANDFWCTLEVGFNTTTDISTENIDYSKTSSTSVEVITEGYYTAINDDTPGKIYIRNNSRQVITAVTLSGLEVYILDDTSTMMSRDKATANIAQFNQTNHIGGNVSIKPGEMVLAYTILPTTANENSIISSFNISVTLATNVVNGASVAENSDIDLVYSESTNLGELINNSDIYYEFRLVSTTDLTDKLYTPNDFVEKVVSASEYHYYYKGIICPHRSIKVFKSFAPNVIVDYLVHNVSQDSSYYVASNYEDVWGLSDGVAEDTNWLNAMKNLYDAPSDAERKQASVIS